MEENKMGVMPVNKLLISMALPMMISMLVQALYNIVDSMFVAQISENALTAVSLAFPAQNLMIAIGTGTGVGINALVSRSLGERNQERANLIANNGLALYVISGILFAIFGLLGSNLFFRAQTDDPEIVRLGTEYLRICCLLSTAIFLQFGFERILQATGRTFYTMLTQGLGAIVNIIMDPILIFGLFGAPKLGVRGAAIATVFGQICAASLACFFNKKKNDDIVINPKKYHLQAHAVKSIYAIGIPSICMASIGSIMTFGMNKILIGFTSTAAAVFGVYFKLQSFIFMPVFGLNNGMVPIIGFNYGARKPDRLMKTMLTQGLGAIVNIIMDPILIFGLFGAPKLGVRGAAIATVFGQICAASLACFFNKKKNDDIVINPKKYHLQAHAVKSIYAIGIPSICMASIGSIMTFGMNKILIGFTSTAAAVFGVYFKLQSFIFMPVFGLNNGMVPIIGFNYGARKPDRLMKTMRLAVTYAVSIMIIGMILFWAFTKQLLGIFNASEQMLAIGIPALRIISLSFLLAGFDIIIISVMQALGHGVISLIISMMRQLVVLLPAAFLFSKIWGLGAVWIAFPLAECVSLCVTLLFWRKVYRNEIQPLYNAER